MSWNVRLQKKSYKLLKLRYKELEDKIRQSEDSLVELKDKMQKSDHTIMIELKESQELQKNAEDSLEAEKSVCAENMKNLKTECEREVREIETRWKLECLQIEQQLGQNMAEARNKYETENSLLRKEYESKIENMKASTQFQIQNVEREKMDLMKELQKLSQQNAVLQTSLQQQTKNWEKSEEMKVFFKKEMDPATNLLKQLMDVKCHLEVVSENEKLIKEIAQTKKEAAQQQFQAEQQIKKLKGEIIRYEGSDHELLQNLSEQELTRYKNDMMKAKITVQSTLIKVKEKIRESKNCSICLNNRKSVLFLPCKHLVTCRNCGNLQTVVNCPLCRADIKDKIEAY